MNAIITDIQRRLEFLEKHMLNLVIDADVHLTDLEALEPSDREKLEQSSDYYHGKPIGVDQALASMALAGVDMCLVWQNPAVTRYTTRGQDNFEMLLKANRYIYEMVQAYPDKFIPGGWIDPKVMEPDLVEKMVRILVQDFGFPIIKMNPAQNQFMMDSTIVQHFMEVIYQYGAIPAFHFGADTPYTPVESLERLVESSQGRPLIAIHMGGGGAGYVEAEETYQKARQLGLRHPNLKYILSAKRDTHMETDLISYLLKGEPYCRNLMCASDYPYGNMSWNFGGFRALFAAMGNGRHPDTRLRSHPSLVTPDAVQSFMGGNMARLAIEGYRSVLKNV